MSTHPSDPPRIADGHAPDAMRELVHGIRRSGPTAGAMDRMSKGLATAGALAAPSSKPPTAPRAEGKLALHKIGFVALAVAGGLVVSWHATQTSTAPEIADPAAVTNQVSADRGQGQSPPPPTEPSSVRPEANHHAATPATISVDDLPSAAPRTPLPSASVLTGGAVRANAKAPEATSGSAAAASELELVQRAQAALPSDAQRALAITDEHAHAYPSGELVQEREVVAVEALSRLGRKDEALRRARAFVQRFPRTPYAARLEVALGRPLTATSADPSERHDPASPPAASAR